MGLRDGTRHAAWALKNGRVVPHAELTIHCDSQAMRYALSVFEGIRGYVQDDGCGVALFAVDQHLDRLRRSLELARLATPAVQIHEAALEELLIRNHIGEDCYVRLAVSASELGDLTTVERTSWTASVSPMGRKPWLGANRRMAVRISPRRKPAEDAFPQAAKNISNYAGPRLALLEAKESGFDSVVLRTPDGMLSEAPTANLFLVRDRELFTPPLTDSLLPGITRWHVLDLARSLGFAASERSLSAADAYEADEAFLCGTGLELAPIASFDGRQLQGDGTLTRALVDAYFRCVRNWRAHRSRLPDVAVAS